MHNGKMNKNVSRNSKNVFIKEKNGIKSIRQGNSYNNLTNRGIMFFYD